MQPTTESRLWLEIRNGNGTSWSNMIEGHLGIVYNLVGRRATDANREDLVGVGSVALCEAASYFKNSESVRGRFSTYAYTRVRRDLISFERTDAPVTITEWRARVEKSVREEGDTLAQELGHEPSVHDLEDRVGPSRLAAVHPVKGVTIEPVHEDTAGFDMWMEN